jgi:hypothetical protein
MTFGSDTIGLPAWLGEAGAVLVSTRDVRRFLGVEERKSDTAEWFAIGIIPAAWVSTVEDASCPVVPVAVMGV